MSGAPKTCKNCIWWDKGYITHSLVQRLFQRCKATPHSEETTEWNANRTAETLKPEFAKTTAMAEDGSGYYAALVTRAEHCCSMWKPSPPQLGE